jgi:hypothetical protein
VGDASLNLALTHLNLADWKPFIGDAAPAGDVGLNVKVTSQAGGKQIAFDVGSDITGLTVRVGTNDLSQTDIHLAVHGQAKDLKAITLASCDLQVNHEKQAALNVSGSGAYNLADGSAELQLKVQAMLARLAQMLPQPGVTVASGDLGVSVHLTQKDKAQSVTGELALTDLTGKLANIGLRHFASQVNFDLGNAAGQISLNQVAGSLSQDGKPGGTFAISGTYQTASQSANLKLNLAGINQNAVGPFLQPALADKQLVSVAINADLNAQYDARGASAVQGGLQVTNLVVNDPSHSIPATPLEAKLQVDAAVQGQTADLHQLQITLTPTGRAQNQIDLQGQVNFSQSTNIEGNLKLTADSLDMTRYYDLFAGKSGAGAPPAATTAAAPATTPAVGPGNQEPAPVTLPLHNFTASAAIGKFYLHEVEITNLLANINVNGSEVHVKPLQLALNGAPIQAAADLNLGVPGYVYDVSLDAQGIPVSPLANTFVPGASGKYSGEINAGVQVKGQGVTGASLQQHLDGRVSLVLTNANIQLIASHTKIFFIPINVQLIATLLNVPEIMQSPLSGVNALVNLGQGRIDVQRAQVLSPAFQGNVHGTIPIADVLTNSPLNLPVEVSLADSLAGKLKLSGAQRADGYTQLPVFLTVTGTIGHPQTKENALVITSLTAGALTDVAGKLIGGKAGETIKETGGMIQGLEGLFGHKTTTNAPATTTTTNAPAKPFNPFHLFK